MNDHDNVTPFPNGRGTGDRIETLKEALIDVDTSAMETREIFALCRTVLPDCEPPEVAEALRRKGREYLAEAEALREVSALLRQFPEGTTLEDVNAKPDDELIEAADRLDRRGDKKVAKRLRDFVASRAA